jgi:peptidoglycan/xylan/chitin deacetylase (PgdA/CDA1 family)
VRINRADLSTKNTLLDQLQEILEPGQRPVEPSFMMGPEHILEMSRNGMTIGSHTASHPILSSLTEAEASMELQESKRLLEGVLGTPIRHVAYPNGPGVVNFDQRTEALAQACGYTSASTSDRGVVTASARSWALPRQGINNDQHLPAFSFKLEEHRFRPLLLMS